jgi:hypothetical protein
VLSSSCAQLLDSQVDHYAIQQALAGAQTVTNSGTFALANGATAGVGGFFKDLKTAKNLIHDQAGVRLRAMHMFAPGDLVDFISAWSDASGRPVIVPSFDDNRSPIRSVGDQGAEGYSGYVLVGCAVFANDNIPASGANAQIIVTAPSHILLLEGAPITQWYPPTYAGNLEAVRGVRSYIAVVARFPSGVAAISGAAYAAAQFA